ncbi:non-symbiotic hemoglobin 2 [Tanacetum coccineum]
MTFSEKQEELVKQSWELMKEDIADLSLYFFTQTLEIAPAAKRLFSFLKDADEIPVNNPKLKAHAIKVFKMTCEAAIQLRERGEVVVSGSTLKYLGSVHLQKGIVAPHFEGEWCENEGCCRTLTINYPAAFTLMAKDATQIPKRRNTNAEHHNLIHFDFAETQP